MAASSRTTRGPLSDIEILALLDNYCDNNDTDSDTSECHDDDINKLLQIVSDEPKTSEPVPAISSSSKEDDNTKSSQPSNTPNNDAQLRCSTSTTAESSIDTQETVQSDEISDMEITKKKTRKRARNPNSWKSAKRSKLSQEGKAYTSVRGKRVNAREIKTTKDCTSCKFKCSEHINEETRHTLFEKYWGLDKNGKDHFIRATTTYNKKQRNKLAKTRRAHSFTYWFSIEEKQIRVCQKFYVGTLGISKRGVYRMHQNKDPVTGTPVPVKQGKHTKRKISDDVKQDVMNHISSFPVVESHYCRSRTSKTYLEAGLSSTKMYEMYVEKCEKDGKPTAVKLEYYRRIINYNFNIEFHKPKSDRCDLCEHYDRLKKEGRLTDEVNQSQSKHLAHKTSMREERNRDRENKEKLVISFDLQNVITCPRAEISSFFYYRKLNVYNLTAHNSMSRKGYCAIWSETTSGRSGNDLASSVIKILGEVVKEHPEVKNITTWSDSCVPQNRNSIISFAMMHFMEEHHNIESITMKYSVPGHGGVQEVDNIHSNIEKVMKVTEFYSPISLIRVLLKANRKQPYKVCQMRNNDFKDYQTCSKSLSFKLIPFTKVCQLEFRKNETIVRYKVQFTTDTNEVDVKPQMSVRTNACFTLPKPRLPSSKCTLNEAKTKDLKSMIKYMPAVDREFYAATLDD